MSKKYSEEFKKEWFYVDPLEEEAKKPNLTNQEKIEKLNKEVEHWRQQRLKLRKDLIKYKKLNDMEKVNIIKVILRNITFNIMVAYEKIKVIENRKGVKND